MGLFDILQKLNQDEVNKIVTKDEDTSTGLLDTDTKREGIIQDVFESQDRIVKYRDYDLMEDRIPEISSALDIFADDVTATDPEKNTCFWINSEHEKTASMLNEVLTDKLNLNEDLWSISRDLIKYGDEFEEVVISQNGLKSVKSLHPSTMYRYEDYKGRLLKFEQKPNFYFNSANVTLYASLPNLNYAASKDNKVEFVPWQIVHSRTRTQYRSTLYGNSFLERVRHVSTMLRLMEEALTHLRLQKSFDRYMIFLDVGQLDPDRSLSYVKQVQKMIRRKRFIGSDGSFTSSISPITPIDDVYLPLRKGDQSRIEKLPGIDVGGRLDDIKYYRSKLISGLKIPAAYLGFTEEYSGFANNTLAQQDKRYIRTVRRYQVIMKNLIKRLCDLQLYVLDFPFDEREFEVHMTNSNQLEVQAMLEISNLRAELAQNLNGVVPLEYIMSKVLAIPEEDIKGLMVKMMGGNVENAGGGLGGADNKVGPDSISVENYNGVASKKLDISMNPDELNEKKNRVILKDLKTKGVDEGKLNSIVKNMYKTNEEFRGSVIQLKSIIQEHKEMTDTNRRIYDGISR